MMRGFLIYLAIMTVLVIVAFTVRSRFAVSEPGARGSTPHPQRIQYRLLGFIFGLIPIAAFLFGSSLSPRRPFETALRLTAGGWAFLGVISATVAAVRGRAAFEDFKSNIAPQPGMSFRSIVLLWVVATVGVLIWSFLHRGA
jgi:hypothetical protein